MVIFHSYVSLPEGNFFDHFMAAWENLQAPSGSHVPHVLPPRHRSFRPAAPRPRGGAAPETAMGRRELLVPHLRGLGKRIFSHVATKREFCDKNKGLCNLGKSSIDPPVSKHMVFWEIPELILIIFLLDASAINELEKTRGPPSSRSWALKKCFDYTIKNKKPAKKTSNPIKINSSMTLLSFSGCLYFNFLYFVK